MGPSSTGTLRTILAFVVGPLAGAAVIVAIYLLLLAFSQDAPEAAARTTASDVVVVFFVLMAYAVPLAAVTAVVLGIPIFLLLRFFDRLTATWSSLAGGILASVPLTIYRSNSTLVPYLDFEVQLMLAAILFVGGASGGWVFWRVQRSAPFE